MDFYVIIGIEEVGCKEEVGYKEESKDDSFNIFKKELSMGKELSRSRKKKNKRNRKDYYHINH